MEEHADQRQDLWRAHPAAAIFLVVLGHQEILDQTVDSAIPTSAAEFKDVALKVNNPQQNVWAIGSNGGSQYAFDTVKGCGTRVFEAPNYWAVDGNGKFTLHVRNAEYKQAMVYAADLVKADLYHPSRLTYNVISGAPTFAARKIDVPRGWPATTRSARTGAGSTRRRWSRRRRSRWSRRFRSTAR